MTDNKVTNKRPATTIPSASTEPAVKKTKKEATPIKCVCKDCEFFASIDGKCSFCARGEPVIYSIERKQLLRESKATLKSLHPRSVYPLITSCRKKDTTFKEFLVKLGEISQFMGPGERFIEQSFVCKRKLKLVLIHDESRSPQKVDEIVIHKIENQPNGGRYATASFYMHSGQRLKAGWMECEDGIVTPHYC
jgi:hypothetical protein